MVSVEVGKCCPARSSQPFLCLHSHQARILGLVCLALSEEEKTIGKKYTTIETKPLGENKRKKGCFPLLVCFCYEDYFFRSFVRWCSQKVVLCRFSSSSASSFFLLLLLFSYCFLDFLLSLLVIRDLLAALLACMFTV